MSKKRIITAIQYFRDKLKSSGITESKIMVFGSVAKRTDTKESDIDLVIISDNFIGKNYFERADLTKYAEISTIKKFIISLDILTVTNQEWQKSQSIILGYAKKTARVIR